MYLPFLQFFNKVSLLHYCIILIWGKKEEGQLLTLVHGSLNQEEQQGEYIYMTCNHQILDFWAQCLVVLSILGRGESILWAGKQIGADCIFCSWLFDFSLLLPSFYGNWSILGFGSGYAMNMFFMREKLISEALQVSTSLSVVSESIFDRVFRIRTHVELSTWPQPQHNMSLKSIFVVVIHKNIEVVYYNNKS